MVSNSAKLNHRTKQHTQFRISASNGSRDMARTKSWWKKKNEHEQSHIASPMGIANNNSNNNNNNNNNNNETGSQSPCMQPRSDPPKMKNSTPDKIVAEKKITKRIGW